MLFWRAPRQVSVLLLRPIGNLLVPPRLSVRSPSICSYKCFQKASPVASCPQPCTSHSVSLPRCMLRHPCSLVHCPRLTARQASLKHCPPTVSGGGMQPVVPAGVDLQQQASLNHS